MNRPARMHHAWLVALAVTLGAVFAGPAYANPAFQWPSRAEYFQAIQRPGALHSSLRRGTVERDQRGSPRARSGALSTVYRMEFPRSRGGSQMVGLRFFHPPPGATDRADPVAWRQRYTRLSEYLRSVKAPPEIIEVRWIDRAIDINGRSLPATVMPWVEARSFDDWIATRLQQRRGTDIERMAHNFRTAMAELRHLNIAHGDLHAGNLLIERGSGTMRLIDYDAMYVPTLAGQQSSEIGSINYQHPNYFHPAPRVRPYGPELDHFSSIVMYLSTLAIAEHPQVWNRYHRPGENMIFTHEDYRNPQASALFQELKASPNARIKGLATLLSGYCLGRPEAVPDLETAIRNAETASQPWFQRP